MAIFTLDSLQWLASGLSLQRELESPTTDLTTSHQLEIGYWRLAATRDHEVAASF